MKSKKISGQTLGLSENHYYQSENEFLGFISKITNLKLYTLSLNSQASSEKLSNIHEITNLEIKKSEKYFFHAQNFSKISEKQ